MRRSILVLGLCVLCVAGVATADLVTDSVGEIIADPILDLNGAQISNDATTIFFTLHVQANIQNVGVSDWGNYMVGIDSVAAAGDTAGNGWGRPITMSSGMDYWLGGWVNGGGGLQVWDYDDIGTSWSQTSSGGVSIGPTSVTYSIALSDLGLSPSDTLTFDVYTSGTGAGDGAIDALSNPAQTIANWGDSYDSVLVSSYTITAIPEPSSLILFGLSGLAIIVARRRMVT